MNRKLLPSFVLLFLSSLLAASPPSPESSETLLKKARGVLAQLEGEITLPGLKEPVEVLRDTWGVPHLYAKNADDLFFAQGFVVAQDRLFQLDMWRRVAVGETAEVLGPKALEGDRFARLLRYRGDMGAEWTSYSPDAKAIATAFTRGINACIDHFGKKLPIEFQILGFAPKKWQPEDCLGRMSGIIMCRNMQTEILRSELINTVGLEKARLLAPTDPIRAFAPVPDLDLKGISWSILAGYRTATKSFDFPLPPSESNNWVVDGMLSASGKPLLANDPHRTLSLPSLRYLVHLNAPGWNVIGSGEPALPGVAVGHNERIAWGFTIVGTDQTDLYVEETNPADPSQYKVGDGWKKMQVVREKVRVKDKAEAVTLELRFTRHGPVIHQDTKLHRAYALKWAGSEPGAAAYLASLALDRASNQKDFLDALKRWKIPALNMVYADKDGTIGWVAAGATPIRKGWDGLLPVPGAGGKYEWQGFLPVKDLPQVFNPKSHFVATANHNILPEGYKHEISYEWAPPYRYERVKQRLLAKKKLNLEDFKSIQHDVVSIPGQTLARLAKMVDLKVKYVYAYDKLLADWDGELSASSRAGPLYAAWLQELLEGFYRLHTPKQQKKAATTLVGVPTLLEALEHPTKALFGDNPKEARDRLLRETFDAAAWKVRGLLGGSPDGWAWGKLHTATFRHPLAKFGPAYEKAFNLGPVPRPGDGHTPNNTRHDEKFQQIHGASYRHLFDLSDWDRALATSTPGQSGQPGSPHYGDLLPLWAKGEYFPLAFSRTKVEQVTRHKLLLKPAAK
jgi:penicillin amidase